MVYLFTGATGFIGQNLARKILCQGDRVFNVTRNNIVELHIGQLGEISSTNTKYEAATLDSFYEKYQIDAVVHLATYYNSETMDDLRSLFFVNIELPSHIARLALRHSSRFISIGSYWEFSSSSGAPNSMYAQTKKMFHDFLDFLSLQGLDVAIVYLYGTYGMRDHRGKILDRMIDSIINRNSIQLSPGFQILNMVHVEDVIDAIGTVLNTCKQSSNIEKQSVYSEREYSLRQIGELIEAVSGIEGFFKWGDLPYRSDEVMVPHYKYKKVIDWCEKKNVETYIKNRVHGSSS